MDLFDTAILNSLIDSKPKEFKQILVAVKFSHNTLRYHLDSLADQGLISKEKQCVKGRGRPRFTYSVPVGKGRPLSVLPNPSIGIVSLSFNKLSQVCRFEKGGFCKKVRLSCNAQICPQTK